MNEISNILPVAIIGAGPGGLALAQGLRKNGVPFKIFERAALRDDYVQGFRLRIRDRGLNALRQNLSDDLWQAFIDTMGYAPASSLVLDDQLNVLPAREEDPEDDSHLEKSISRITLRQILLSGLEDHLEIGRTFDHYREDSDGVTLTFTDGHEVRAALVVGADGANSKVRAQLVPEAKSIDTGVRRIAGKMTLAAAAHHGILPLLLDNTLQIRPSPGHEGRSIMITAHRVTPEAFSKHGIIGANDASHAHIDGFHFDNQTSYVWWNTAYNQGELGPDEAISSLDGAGLIKLTLSKMQQWHPAVRALIAHSDPSTVALLRVRTSVSGSLWRTGRVTVLGDAIHAMTYFRALGGNSAMYDAGLLTRALVSIHQGADRSEAISKYESALRDHGYAAVDGSLKAMLATLQPSAPVAVSV